MGLSYEYAITPSRRALATKARSYTLPAEVGEIVGTTHGSVVAEQAEQLERLVTRANRSQVHLGDHVDRVL